MKKLNILILSSFVLLVMNSCSKIDKKTQFDLSIEEEVEIPSLVGIDLPFNLPTTAIHSTINEQLEIQNKKKEKIEEIYLSELEASILSPSNQDFNFLKSIKIYIYAEELDEILVAEASELTNENLIELKIEPIKNVDLTSYVKKDNINLRLEIVTDETIFQKITVKINSTFWVDAKFMGI